MGWLTGGDGIVTPLGFIVAILGFLGSVAVFVFIVATIAKVWVG